MKKLRLYWKMVLFTFRRVAILRRMERAAAQDAAERKLIMNVRKKYGMG